jgi:hypothetical protein
MSEANDRYMIGLKSHVYQRVRLKNPNSLSETIRVAQQFDEAVFNCRQSVGMFNRNSNAMELDSMEDDDDQNSSVELEEEDTLCNDCHYGHYYGARLNLAWLLTVLRGRGDQTA